MVDMTATTNSGLRVKNIPFCPKAHDADHVRDVQCACGSCGSPEKAQASARVDVPTTPSMRRKTLLLRSRTGSSCLCLEGPAHVCEVSCQSGGVLVSGLGGDSVVDLWKVPPSRCYNRGRARRRSTSTAGVCACDIPGQQAARAEQGTHFRSDKHGPLQEGDLQDADAKRPNSVRYTSKSANCVSSRFSPVPSLAHSSSQSAKCHPGSLLSPAPETWVVVRHVLEGWTSVRDPSLQRSPHTSLITGVRQSPEKFAAYLLLASRQREGASGTRSVLPFPSFSSHQI